MIPDDRLERLEYWNEKLENDEALTVEEQEMLIEDLNAWTDAMEDVLETLSEAMSENMDIISRIDD